MAGEMYPILIYGFPAFIRAGADVETHGSYLRIRAVLAYGRLQAGHSLEMARRYAGDVIEKSLANFTVPQGHSLSLTAAQQKRYPICARVNGSPGLQRGFIAPTKVWGSESLTAS